MTSRKTSGNKTSGKKRLTSLIQDEIDKGATKVEEVHRAIADLPITILEQIDFVKGPVKAVERIQDHTIGAVYDLIRYVNEQVWTLGSEQLAKAAKPKPAAKKAAKPRARRT